MTDHAKLSHTHITQGDALGCPACDKATGRAPLPTPPEPDARTVYRPLTPDEFNAGAGYEYHGVHIVEGEWADHVFAYGHVDRELYARVVNDYDREMGGFDPESPYEADHVEHRWAVNLTPEDAIEEWFISWSAEYQDHEQRFPVTVVSR